MNPKRIRNGFSKVSLMMENKIRCAEWNEIKKMIPSLSIRSKFTVLQSDKILQALKKIREQK
ncbi:hypothetical protein QQ056_17120 [Oscillatoria laete-virens NRMC-F 0139]|nr:hypothetical protein [Oscillatoria laete-virens]MDL5055255.1 hypothetical protein [Oscillatoria laete-virens NRMC-F 0139]